jgi:hypothetical protein
MGLTKAGAEKSALGTVFCPDAEFRESFPCLTQLLSKARVTEVVGAEGPRLLFGWTAWTEDHLWWLSPPPGYAGDTATSKLLSPEHQLLLRHFGGILESEYLPKFSTLASNQNFLFVETKCQRGFGDCNDYLLKFSSQFSLSLDTANYLTFVQEANGNRTAYRLSDGKVIMCAPDHYFQYIEPLTGWPENSLYSFKYVESFCDYVEFLAVQWLTALTPNEDMRARLLTKGIYYVEDPKEIFAHMHPELRNKVRVTSIFDTEILELYKDVMLPTELFSIANLRGIAKTPDGRGLVRQLRREWRKYFSTHDTVTKSDLYAEAARLDATYGRRFKPPILHRSD